MKSVYLATQSKQRQALFGSLGVPFTAVPADIDELAIDHEDHVHRAGAVARAKAEKIATLYPQDIIIAADTFVVLDNQRLEKPLDKEEARAMLRQMSGREMAVQTGWAYFDDAKQLRAVKTTTTMISFRIMSDREIESYIQRYPVTDWAGSFSLTNQEGLSFIASMNGSLTGVLGLPIEELIPLLRISGVLT